jgi:hypothetical protein
MLNNGLVISINQRNIEGRLQRLLLYIQYITIVFGAIPRCLSFFPYYQEIVASNNNSFLYPSLI